MSALSCDPARTTWQVPVEGLGRCGKIIDDQLKASGNMGAHRLKLLVRHDIVFVDVEPLKQVANGREAHGNTLQQLGIPQRRQLQGIQCL
jgi:hypothetical protein